MILRRKPCPRNGRALVLSGLVAGIGFLAMAASTSAQEYRLFDKFSLTLGAGFTDLGTTLAVNLKEFPEFGVAIDFESDLGLSDSESIPTIGGEWRIARKHHLRFGYSDVDRDASRQIATEIRFGDTVFPVEETVAVSYEITSFLLGYTYYPILKDRVAFGVGGGIRALDTSVFLEAQELDESEDQDVAVPLPFVGLGLRYGITPKWRFHSDLGVLAVEVGDVDGSQVLVSALFEHHTTKHVGFGAGLSFQQVDADLDDDPFEWDIDQDILVLAFFARFYTQGSGD